MTITERIFVLLSQKDIKQKQFAELINVNEKTVSAWKKNNSLPPLNKISNISDVLGVSIDFLLTGKEKTSNYDSDLRDLIKNYNTVDECSKALIRERATALAELEAAKKKDTVKIPLKQSSKQTETEEITEPEYISLPFPALPASAGAGEYLHEDTTSYIKVPATNLTGRASFALRVHGDSMEPAYFDGDIVLVAADADVNIGDIGIFIVNGEGFIKERGKDRLISLNNKYKDIRIGSDDTCVCKGKVIGSL